MHRPRTDPLWVQHLDRLHLLTPLRVLVVLVVALVATFLIRRLIARTLARILERTMPDDQTRARIRHRALGSALRAALTGVIWTVATITMISEVGVNIGGLVATATVVGGAIAFGAQTLIRDVISGFFVLSDDQYGVGDEVDLGLTSGTVERVTLRSVRLRDGEGRIWHVAHGNVLRVANLTKAATALLDVQVSRTMPVDAALAAVHDFAVEFSNRDEVAPMLLSTPVVQGVVDAGDDRITVRTSAPCQIGRKDQLQRAWQLAVLRAFEQGALIAPVPTPAVVIHHALPPAPVVEPE
jgi:small-conductance mechanosensitive channel